MRCWAAGNAHHKVVEVLLANANKANIHADDDKALRWATAGGHYKVVQLLLSQGEEYPAALLERVYKNWPELRPAEE